ncbi:AbrB/MazE/SpoVT family DNA-binding domain-containing protein [Methylobacterium thuringiense]|uniref:SpoVT-AbrB domain-containing protein n=1 Tax=Methylobacterium thuringiense TaxID=1003091 RepID=A0ABQ4TTT1_9HYPH|nr:type II toxin-antitoxin system PrlF family antitoxin [Methylobacterium thuringiense]GJE57035.1 hypothetical protein EKPJFOCH_3545 [Methylobacterium thuringiense]
MKVIEATVTSKGQVTIPSSLRKALGLKVGDKLVFAQDAHGRFTVEARIVTLADLRGIVGPGGTDPEIAVDSERVVGWIEESRAARWRRMQPPIEADDA